MTLRLATATGLLATMLWFGAPWPQAARAENAAAATQSPDSVRAAAEQALHERYALPGSRVVVSSAPLDLRLRLDACREPLRAVISPYAAAAPHMTVRVQCPQPGGWTVRVPLQLQLFRNVLVTSRPLLRGDGLDVADVRAEERDVTRLGYGYLENLAQVAGRTLARSLPAGSVLSPGALGGRRMVRAGDRVEMVARLDGIEVRAAGVAMGSGDNGARLRVRNENSGKVVEAMVSAPGVVVALP
ncbi:MAG: flagellar basal body P-ring formation chaperone FlgA [Rhodanobacter sp.]|uniref:flagellar basal body P-ring formation chaperone FlgA n=1 Tax=Rhodanobacter sp. KK11 TaxID=3083255 RepID=UPI002965E316|nr:flagellar basal body P-ring formation chaperone FlgA [Rhodanobacter sp. KK11]MDW2983341.1 flagellar basal body P-ring formation chaperone FlgA [Rhodanobacter sp. KK11]